MQKRYSAQPGIVQGVSDYPVQHVAAYKKCYQSHRIGSRYTHRERTYPFTEDDTELQKIPDAIANGSWPVEIWEQIAVLRCITSPSIIATSVRLVACRQQPFPTCIWQEEIYRLPGWPLPVQG